MTPEEIIEEMFTLAKRIEASIGEEKPNTLEIPEKRSFAFFAYRDLFRYGNTFFSHRNRIDGVGLVILPRHNLYSGTPKSWRLRANAPHRNRFNRRELLRLVWADRTVILQCKST